MLNLPKALLQYATVPIQYGLYQTGERVSKQFEFIILARTAAQKNQALTMQLADVLSENANLQRKLAEKLAFDEQMISPLNPKTYSMVAARPVGLQKHLSLDKGQFDGISLNQAVIFKDNFIGKISEISPKKSKVILLSDPESKVSAFASNQVGKARGILSGKFGSEMILERILKVEPIEVGDLVYSEGTEGDLPRGLVLGKVTEVIVEDNELFNQAKVVPLFEIANLDVVFVITN